MMEEHRAQLVNENLCTDHDIVKINARKLIIAERAAYLSREAAASAVSFKPEGASSRGMYSSTSYTSY